MILQVKIINGVKKLVPLTTDSGQGLPLGAITAYYGTTPPNGYLLCDGSSFDSTVYPALYTLLGDNHTPDLRECTLKGIGENPNATDHVKAGGLTLGEFLDDRLQEHTHLARTSGSGSPGNQVSVLNSTSQTGQSTNINSGRFGATTEVKSVGVNYIIKAVIGPIESSEADQVVQTIKQNLIKTVEVQITSQNDGYFWQDLPVDTAKILNIQVLSAHQANAAVVLCRNNAGTKTGLRFFSPTNYSSINGTFTVLITYLNN